MSEERYIQKMVDKKEPKKEEKKEERSFRGFAEGRSK